jgi:hypothetical protein
MAFQLVQTTGGELTFEPARATVQWQLRGTIGGGIDPFDFIASYALAQIPRTFIHPRGTLWLQDIQIHENYSARSYSITAPYGREKKESGAYQITVDQTGGTVHVTAGTRIAGYARPGKTPVDHHGLIGVDENDHPQGVDIPVQMSNIIVNFRHPEAILNAAYVKAIGKLTGYVNSGPFLTYEAGEVLFMGTSFTETNTEATAQYSFAISYNATDLVLGEITVETKAGWDVLSMTYQDGVEDGEKSKSIKTIEVIRPAGREWVDFVAAFGWGG